MCSRAYVNVFVYACMHVCMYSGDRFELLTASSGQTSTTFSRPSSTLPKMNGGGSGGEGGAGGGGGVGVDVRIGGKSASKQVCMFSCIYVYVYAYGHTCMYVCIHAIHGNVRQLSQCLYHLRANDTLFIHVRTWHKEIHANSEDLHVHTIHP